VHGGARDGGVVAELVHEHEHVEDLARHLLHRLVPATAVDLAEHLLEIGAHELAQVRHELLRVRGVELLQQAGQTHGQGRAVQRDNGFLAHQSAEVGVVLELQGQKVV